ncbi:MAG: hypothetical protein AAF401_01250 [Pseudomonadota bacterium]
MKNRFLSSVLGVFLAAGIGVSGAQAQSGPLGAGEKDALRQEQQQIFKQMFDDPDNLDLMFRYSLVSIQLEDLEAAITTLERMLIYNKDLPRVHMELGAAYYRLGSYKTANYYFNNVKEFENVPAQVLARVQEFQDAIEQRTQTTVVRGSVGAGVVYASNANLGPDDPSVLVFGFNAVLADDFLESDDFGFRATAALSHIVDLDRPNGDFWQTDLGLYTLNYFDTSNADIDSFSVRTGPVLSLTDEQFGPKLRPLVQADHVRAGNDGLYSTIGLGAELSDTLSDTMSVFGSALIGYRDYQNGRDAFDQWVVRASGGMAYIPNPNLLLRGSLSAERKDADADENSTIELGARLSATYAYDSELDFAGRLWTAGGFLQASYRFHDDPDPTLVGATGTQERKDFDLRVGLNHTFYLKDGLWISAEADALMRDSNIRNFDIDNLGGGITVGLDF